MIHERKILPKRFKKISSEADYFEMTTDDRSIQAGDQIIFREYNENNLYTGRSVKCKVVCGGMFDIHFITLKIKKEKSIQ